MVASNILNKQFRTVDKGWSSSLLRNVTSTSELVGSCEHCNERSGSIKDGEFHD
jgi:hypothetical protein